jgi:hypothetical protein
MKYQQVSTDQAIQDAYDRLRKSGMAHKLAELLALREPPKHRDTYSPMHPRAGRGHGGTNR